MCCQSVGGIWGDKQCSLIQTEENYEYVREYDKKQYSITLKNFGEIPSAKVVARSTFSNSALTRDVLDKGDVHEFDLGPLLPNIEKRYWILINSDIIERTIQGTDSCGSPFFVYICGWKEWLRYDKSIR